MGRKTLTLKKKATTVAQATKPNRQPKVHRVSSTSANQTVFNPESKMTTETQAQLTTDQTEAAPAPSMMELAQSMVAFKVLTPFASCLVTPDQLQDAIDAKYNEIYIFANGEFFQHMQLRGNRHVRLKVDGLPSKYKQLEDILKQNIPSIKEELNFLPDGKIPGAMWDQIVEFFRQVMKVKKSDMEAHAWILWSEEKGYHISIPKQVVSKASVNYAYDAESLPADCVIVADVHSHNTMGAFYSGTDERDDKDKIYYTGVVGNITADDYKWVMRFNLREKKIPVHLDDIFEMSTTVEVPAEWLDQVEVQTYKGGGGKGGRNWQQYIGNGGGQGNANGTNATSGSPGSTPQNPAKWTANSPVVYPTTASHGKEGTGSSSADNFRGHNGFYREDATTGTLWDDLGDGAYSFGGADWPPQVDSETKSSRRAEMEDLLAEVPSSSITQADLDRYDEQATAWLKSKGFDPDADDLNIMEARGFKVPEVEEDQDPVGAADKDVEDAYEIVDGLITDLEGEDEKLQDIINTAYHLMTEKGQAKLQTNGF